MVEPGFSTLPLVAKSSSGLSARAEPPGDGRVGVRLDLTERGGCVSCLEERSSEISSRLLTGYWRCLSLAVSTRGAVGEPADPTGKRSGAIPRLARYGIHHDSAT